MGGGLAHHNRAQIDSRSRKATGIPYRNRPTGPYVLIAVAPLNMERPLLRSNNPKQARTAKGIDDAVRTGSNTQASLRLPARKDTATTTTAAIQYHPIAVPVST